MLEAHNKHLLDGLSSFQKILLITDGTVTKLLEHYLDEPIKVVKLDEITQNYDSASLVVDADLQDTPSLEREILLQGQYTKTNWIYAKSNIFLKHLQEDFLTDLLESNEPIGKLWAKYKLETYKKILYSGKERAGKLARHFGISANDKLITRTYSVYSNRKVIMIITEKFPTSYFISKY